MRPISNQNRFGRFSVKSDADIHLIIQKTSGGSTRWSVVNVSPAGLGAIGAALESDDTGFAVGDVIPGSRLRFAHYDVPLGRVICRYINTRDGLALCGFSLIDLKVPLDGPLSRHLDGYIATSPVNDRPVLTQAEPVRLAVAGPREEDEGDYADMSPRAQRFFRKRDWVPMK